MAQSAKELTDAIRDIEKRLDDPATLEIEGSDTVGLMQKARAEMIGRLNDLNQPFKKYNQSDIFRESSHSAMVEANGIVGPALFGQSGDRSMTKALQREGEFVDEDHLNDLAQIYDQESSDNVRAATNHLQEIQNIRDQSISEYRGGGNPAGPGAGEDPTTYAHRIVDQEMMARSRRSGMI